MIGTNIKLIRQKRRLSMSQLAALAGVSKSYLSDLERGERKNPSISYVRKIADVLGIELEVLFTVKTSVNSSMEK